MANVQLTTTRDGLIEYLKSVTNNIDNNNLYAVLFTNDVTVTENTILGDLTLSTNISIVELQGSNWNIVYNSRGEATYGVDVDFVFTGDDDIYGVCIVNGAQNTLIAAGDFTENRTVLAGDTIKFSSLQITLGN